ncbi:SDR family oxidoreductase [Catenulispora sp. NL8]|uniref:SDR family oxidoreductase n=1 Tax=Catenulispora pinistramenti TaxID=2705254 RepID=A0ABS5L2L9_9ACTN|nr:SDR family oxidoreductase [Catenulispora pinistramenti]MBS2552375.1 SDR family oxidoreductase [Catenulispora pinistramenti]
MDLRLADRVVVVTGGASGIGAACVEAFRAEGARVAVVDREPSAPWPVDVTDEARVAAALDAVAATHGGIDILVCCAGISGPVGTHVPEIAVRDWDSVMAVNARGAFLSAKHAVPHLRRAEAPSIVLLASDSSLLASEGMAPYCASKGAVLMLGKALATDLAPDGIRVNCVCPSIVDTPMSRADMGCEDGFDGVGYPVQAAAEVAALVVFLASPVARPVNGTHLLSDFGMAAKSGFPMD